MKSIKLDATFSLIKTAVCLILVLTLFAGCGDNKAVSSVTSGETASVEEIPMHLTRENEQKPFVVVNRYNIKKLMV